MKTLFISFLISLLLVASTEAACVMQTSGELTATLTWTNADPVTTDTVNILRSNSAGTETLLRNIPFGTTFTDTVPQPTTTISYFYEIQAKGPGGVGTSAEVCKTFQAAPPAPTGVGIQ